MTQVQILPPAAKFLKKLKDKKLKSLYKEAIEMICEDYSIGRRKGQVIWQECTVMTFIIIKLIMNWHIG